MKIAAHETNKGKHSEAQLDARVDALIAEGNSPFDAWFLLIEELKKENNG